MGNIPVFGLERRRSATITIASSTSLNKEDADYICNGTDDHVQIQAAIDEIEAHTAEGGGVIQLMEGKFKIGDTITISKGHLTLRGVGAGFLGEGGTAIHLLGGVNKDMILLEGADTQYFVYIRDMFLNGNKANNTAGGGIINDDGNFNDIYIENVFVGYCKEQGIKSAHAWGWVLDKVVLEFMEGYAIDFNLGNSPKILDCKIGGNLGSRVVSLVDNIGAIIQGNLISTNAGATNGQHGLFLDLNNAVVSGNTFKGTNTDGIAMYLMSGSEGMVATGNSFDGTGVEATGIELAGQSPDHNVITGNVFVDATGALTYTSEAIKISSTATGNRIENNIGADETVTSGSVTLQPWGFTKMDSTGGAITATLGSGYYVGQTKTIVMTNASTSSTVSITNHETENPEVATFNAVDETGVFMWTGTEWVTIKATCTFL